MIQRLTEQQTASLAQDPEEVLSEILAVAQNPTITAPNRLNLIVGLIEARQTVQAINQSNRTAAQQAVYEVRQNLAREREERELSQVQTPDHIRVNL